jgi:two-component system response regulator PilR (NtrC family)
LADEVEKGTFREDLYYRLNVIRIHLPPLRERRDDIPYLARHFLNKYNQELGRDIQSFSPETMEILLSQPYPGNVRELENLIEHAVTFATDGEITPDALPDHIRGGSQDLGGKQDLVTIPPDGMDIEAHLAEIERKLLLNALKRTNGIRKDAAELLGISFRSIRYKLAKYGIDENDS